MTIYIYYRHSEPGDIPQNTLDLDTHPYLVRANTTIQLKHPTKLACYGLRSFSGTTV